LKATAQIFLCHASEDKEKIIEIHRRLTDEGLKPWLDKVNLLPGQRWEQEIPKAIKASDFILVFLSKTSVTKRGYVQKEFKLALDVLNEIPEGQIFIIPVRLDDCEVPEQFRQLHWCDLFEHEGFEKILEAIHVGIDRLGIIKPTGISTHQLHRLSEEDVNKILKDRFKQELALRGELEMQLEALTQASARILTAMTEKDAVETMLDGLRSIGYSKGMLSLVNQKANTIEGKYAIGENWKIILQMTKYDLNSENILAQAIRSKMPILSKDCENDQNCDQIVSRKANIKSQYVIPLIVMNKAIGTLQVDLTDLQMLVHGDLEILKKRMKIIETFAIACVAAIRSIRDFTTIERLTDQNVH
jgi:hypothetical protein